MLTDLSAQNIAVRCARLSDLDDLSSAESLCFPPAEAAGRDEMQKRLKAYPDHYLLLFEGGALAAYVGGAVTERADLEDFMFSDASIHDQKGSWQMVFGLGTCPAFRKKGYAFHLMRRFIAMAKEEGRRGVVLTCKPQLLSFYSALGFEDEGVCPSSHGGQVWHQMRITF